MATAVVGAGGPTGLECVKQLLAGASVPEVRAVVRDVAKHQDRFPKDGRLKVVAGDVTNPSSLGPALSGVANVIFTASGSTYFSAAAVDHKGVANVAAAAKAAGAQHMVLVSSRLVTPKNRWHPIRNVLNWVRWGLMDEKLKGEAALRSSGMAYTIVRPGGLGSGAGGTVRILAEQGDVAPRGSSSIARADVAAVCVAALNNPAARNVTLELSTAPASSTLGTPADSLPQMFKGLQPDT
ncbi:hypothetical protein QJQ45_006470 [Haematococcus lacustris]|nr:hypothetical protein QJQ45_006470 [Haematococcus lacustris]